MLEGLLVIGAILFVAFVLHPIWRYCREADAVLDTLSDIVGDGEY